MSPSKLIHVPLQLPTVQWLQFQSKFTWWIHTQSTKISTMVMALRQKWAWPHCKSTLSPARCIPGKNWDFTGKQYGRWSPPRQVICKTRIKSIENRYFVAITKRNKKTWPINKNIVSLSLSPDIWLPFCICASSQWKTCNLQIQTRSANCASSPKCRSDWP